MTPLLLLLAQVSLLGQTVPPMVPMVGAAQSRPTDAIVADLERTLAELKVALAQVTVQPTDNLQAALDRGGEIHLVGGQLYPGSFVVRTAGTTLWTHGASLTGSATGPALDIQASDVVIDAATAGTAWDQSVIRVGHNDATQTPENIPKRVVLRHVNVPTHRGKRAYEIHGEVRLLACAGADVYDPAGRDSQVIWIHNTTGNVEVTGDYAGASETLLLGGDSMKMPGVVPDHIWIHDARFAHPLAWQTDGVSRTLKTLLEVKTGRHVLVQRVALDGSWKDGQDGYAMVVTPRAGGEIHDLVFEDVIATHVAGGFNITGADYATVTPEVLSGFVARRVRVTTNKTLYGGRGIFALITTEPADLLFDDCTGIIDGDKLFEYAFGTRLLADGTRRTTGKLGSLTVTNGRYVAGLYSFSLAGQQNATNWGLSVNALLVTGNTFAAASAILVRNLPMNTYVDRATFDALTALSQ